MEVWAAPTGCETRLTSVGQPGESWWVSAMGWAAIPTDRFEVFFQFCLMKHFSRLAVSLLFLGQSVPMIVEETVEGDFFDSSQLFLDIA